MNDEQILYTQLAAMRPTGMPGVVVPYEIVVIAPSPDCEMYHGMSGQQMAELTITTVICMN